MSRSLLVKELLHTVNKVGGARDFCNVGRENFSWVGGAIPLRCGGQGGVGGYPTLS